MTSRIVTSRMSTSTSGIIATFNQQQYIAEAILSLASQVDELIVIDDCSTDATQEVIASLNLPGLVSLRNETQLGVSGSYARAVDRASGDILLIQGGDDRSLPGRAAAQAAAFADPEVTLVHSLPVVINANGARLPDELAAEFLIGGGSSDPLAFLLFEANYICAPAAAIRRRDYLKFGGFRAGLDLLQDYGLWLQLASAGKFVCLDEPVVEYRKHGSNLSREYVGVDAPKQRRLSAEREFIRNHFLATAAKPVLARLAHAKDVDLTWFAGLTRAEMVALIQLSHDDKLVFRRGLAYLFEVAGSPSGSEQLARLRLTLADLTSFSITADHDNLEDVGRSLAAVQSLRRLSSTERTG
jgi:glycosyltransferase involved in cell wall biosynthesis